MNHGDLTIMMAQREHELAVKQSLEAGRVRRELAARPRAAATRDPGAILHRLWRIANRERQNRAAWAAPGREECFGRVVAADGA